MAINPKNTYLKLIHTELTPEHQLTFTDVTAQKSYFNGLTGLVLDDYSYQRKDNIIRVPRRI